MSRVSPWPVYMYTAHSLDALRLCAISIYFWHWHWHCVCLCFEHTSEPCKTDELIEVQFGTDSCGSRNHVLGTMSPPGDYNWTIRARQRGGLRQITLDTCCHSLADLFHPTDRASTCVPDEIHGSDWLREAEFAGLRRENVFGVAKRDLAGLADQSSVVQFTTGHFLHQTTQLLSVYGSSKNSNEPVYHSPILFTITNLSWNMQARSGIPASHLNGQNTWSSSATSLSNTPWVKKTRHQTLAHNFTKY